MNWLTTPQAAEYANRHEKTISRAAAAGELHGVQRTAPNGRWSFRPGCVDAWLAGEPCEHQQSTNVARLRAS